MSINVSRKEISKEEALMIISDKFRNFKDFIQEINVPYIEIRNTTDEIVFDEVDYYGRQYMIILPLQITNKNPKVRFRDDLTDINKLWVLHGVELEITTPIYDKFILDIKKLGCRLYDSGNGGNESYQWYDLEMSLNDFSKDILTQCTNLWTEYNKRLSEYEK